MNEIIFSEVMYDDYISGELPEHINFIKTTCKRQFEEWGYKFKILHSKHNYSNLFIGSKIQKSKHPERNGKYWGFPMQRGCYLNSRCKTFPIKEYIKENKGCVQYVGIAIDEKCRLQRMHNRNNNEISLLEKYKYTEEMALNLCREYNLLSPIYENKSRGGCWFCPNQRIDDLRNLRKNYPELWNRLLKMGQRNDIANVYFRTYDKKTISDYEERFNKELK